MMSFGSFHGCHLGLGARMLMRVSDTSFGLGLDWGLEW